MIGGGNFFKNKGMMGGTGGLPANAVPERPAIPPNTGGMMQPGVPSKPQRPGMGWGNGNPAFQGGMQGWRDKLANALAGR